MPCDHFMIIRHAFPSFIKVFWGSISKGFWNNRHDFEDESQSAGCVFLSPNHWELWSQKKPPVSEWEVKEPVCFDSRCLAAHSWHTGECGDRLKSQKVKAGEEDRKTQKWMDFKNPNIAYFGRTGLWKRTMSEEIHPAKFKVPFWFQVSHFLLWEELKKDTSLISHWFRRVGFAV